MYRSDGVALRPAGKRARPAVRVLAAAFFAILMLEGCARQAPRPAPPVSPAAPADLSELPAALAAWRPLPALRGRAYLRLSSGGEDLPGLNVRFSIHAPRRASIMLRPGVLPPVLSLWVGEDAWRLLLPRQRLYTALSRAGQETAPSAATLGALIEYLITPQLLVSSIRNAAVVSREGEAVLRGSWSLPGEGGGLAEVAVDPATLAVIRWSLSDDRGESLVRVAYEPPNSGKAAPGSIYFLIPSLEARGALEVREIEAGDWAPAGPPELPEGWDAVAPSQLPWLFEGVEGGPAGQP